jgi:cysteinyl-tRNA synthetase
LRTLGRGTFSVQNITDMGHMHQGQLEAGEDKGIAAARAAGKSGREIARFFTEAFFRDCGRMAFLPADATPRASEHVPERIALVRAQEIPVEVASRARERETRLRASDYPAADALREKIRAAGYDVVDAAEGTAVLRKRQETRRG